MKVLNFKYIRLFFITLCLLLTTILFAQIFFLVTNSNLNEIIPINQTFIPFEDDVIESLPWDHNGSSDWTISDEQSFSGQYSLKSGQIDDNEYSSISLTIEIYEDGYVDFWCLVYSEYSPSGNYFYDGLQFFIDGNLQDQFQPDTDGDSEWKYANYPISAGMHTLSWSYVKDDEDGDTASDIDSA